MGRIFEATLNKALFPQSAAITHSTGVAIIISLIMKQLESP
jgi:hypothetical protein